MASSRATRSYPVLASLLATAVASPGFAQQTPPPIRPVVTPPGNVLPRPEELQRASPPPPAAAPRTARVDASAAALAGACPESLLESTLTAPLAGVDFAGPGGAALSPVIAKLLAPLARGSGAITLDGQPRPIRVVCELRDAAQAALRDAGYIAAVQVPPQTIASGRLALTVITAKIVELRVRGEAGRGRAALGRMLERLRTLDPLNERDAERVLLNARDVPGTLLSLVLRPAGTRPGEVIGEIAIERQPGALFVNLQNTGSREIGRFGGLVRGELYGLTGLGDRTSLGVYATTQVDEQVIAQAGHDFAIGSRGFRVAGQIAYAWTRPTLRDVGDNFALRSESLLTSLAGSYPLLRRVDRNVNAGGGFELIEQRTRANGDALNRDKLRIVFARLDGGIAERSGVLPPRWATNASLELRQGLDILGASQPGATGGTVGPSRFDGDPTAFVTRGRLGGEGRVRFGASQANAVTLALEGRGQWSNNALLSYEEFSVGNLTLGRGYDPGDASADRAYGGTAELRVGKPFPQTVRELAYEALVFTDAVRIYNLDRQTSETRRTLLSYGAGVRAIWGNHARLELLYAHPVDRALSTDEAPPGDRVLLTLTVRAWPW